MTRIVIGNGQVGRAVANVLSTRDTVHVLDVHIPPATEQAESIHICYPWSDDFEEQAMAYVHGYQPIDVLVHSTVPVGTCDRHGWIHAPIRGRHPDLEEGIRTFPMHFGGHNAARASKIFAAAVPERIIHPRAAETEAGKLWELAQYGIQVRVEKEIYAYCEQHGLDYDTVYGRFAETYNAGYQQLAPQFVRPILQHMPGPLGGHCVAQNAPLLDSTFVNDLLHPISPESPIDLEALAW